TRSWIRLPSGARERRLTDEDGAAFVREQLPGRGVHPGLELVPEVLDRRRDRRGGAVAQGAERAAEDVLAEVEQLVDVALLAAARLEPLEDLHQPPGALAAGRALAAGLVLVELGPAQHRPDHRGGVVEQLQRPGAEHRA